VNVDDERKDPRRLLNRAEAVRRLIHTAVRMFALGEDPFAVHLLIQSADKMLFDIAKNRGVDLAFDWEIFIKDEHHSEFFAMYRETYNFFKHANRGPENLPVYDIAAMNASQLTIAIENYAKLFGTVTAHMALFRTFALLWKPNWFPKKMGEIANKDKYGEFAKAMGTLRAATPGQLFSILMENRIGNAAFERERTADLMESSDFYLTPFEH
jgi:hypothetical protein